MRTILLKDFKGSHGAEDGPEPRPTVVNADGFQEKCHTEPKKHTNGIC